MSQRRTDLGVGRRSNHQLDYIGHDVNNPDGSVTHFEFPLASPCRWFALCDNEATTTRQHPILGDVPICDRCNDKIDRLGGRR